MSCDTTMNEAPLRTSLNVELAFAFNVDMFMVFIRSYMVIFMVESTKNFLVPGIFAAENRNFPLYMRAPPTFISFLPHNPDFYY